MIRQATTSAEILAAATIRPDLILLHTELPPLGGLEVCRRLKADPVLASVPVLCYSASFADVTVRLEALAAGADDYLLEPTPPKELVAHIKALLSLTPPRPYKKPHARPASSGRGVEGARQSRPGP